MTLYVPRSRTQLGTRTFSVLAHTLWNNVSIHLATSTDAFYRKLKTYLLRKIF